MLNIEKEKTPKLLSRDEFREAVFKRDNYTCVLCRQQPAQDAHHILERRLWPDGGYYLENGASVCGDCHIKCEQTLFSVEEVREAAGIKKKVVPPNIYDGEIYDKWGNPILENGRRLRGELFEDESVQKILAPVLDKFTHYVKYPRTRHLPWSPGYTKDDVFGDTEHFEGKEVVVTLKMDGENTTMYRDHIHARSLDSRNHPSRNWVKQYWCSICGEIPDGWRICGENLYAKHSIKYSGLSTYFYGFSIWNSQNTCLSYNETLEWFTLLGIRPVQEIWRGQYSEQAIKEAFKPFVTDHEGYVVRLTKSYQYKDFGQSVMKYVRANHVSSSNHWMYEKMEINEL